MKTTRNIHGITLVLAWHLATTPKERMHSLKSTRVFSFRQCCLTLLFLLILPVAVRAQFTYTTNGSSVTITGYTGPGGVVVIPNSTNGHTVTSIGTEAFQSSLLTSVVIPTSITNIEVEAFVACPNLTNISVTTGNSSFSSINGVLFDRGQDALIEYPEGLTPTNGTYTMFPPYSTVRSIGPYAFAYCSHLTNLVVTVTNIGEYAFAECTNLTSVAVTNTVETVGIETSIEPYAFAYCSHLANVLAFNANIDDFAFTECTSLTSIIIPNQANSSDLSHVKPTSVGVAAFTFCTSLNNVFIGSSVTNIGGLAFAFCTNLTTVYFASNAPPDFGNAFDEDPAATVYYSPGTTGWGSTFGDAPTVGQTPASDFEYYVDDGSITIDYYSGSDDAVVIPGTINGYPVTGIEEGTFIKEGMLYGRQVTSIIIPNTVTSIEPYTFRNCITLTNILIPNSVTNIGQEAFQNCTSLTSIAIPNSVTSIESYTFNDCASLTNILIPNGVTNIEAEAFYGCTSLTSIAIPGTVASIGVEAFLYSDNLTNISVDAANSFYSSLNGVLFDKAQDAVIEYPPGLGDTYTIPTSVTNIEADAFYGCINLTNIVIPNSVINIGEEAFSNCFRLTSIFIPGSVANIGAEPFLYCNNLTTISVDTTNLFYSSLNGVLYDKAQDTIIEYPEGLKNSTYTIPNSVTNIGQGAFQGCTSLASIVIPGSIASIGEDAFTWSYSLTSAYFEGNAPPDLGNAFADDTATVYYLPGTTGWGATFGGATAVLWNPQATAFTTTGGQLGFNLTGPTNATIVVQACTNLANPVWIPVSTNHLTGGSSTFSDPSWADYPSRFYRFTAP